MRKIGLAMAALATVLIVALAVILPGSSREKYRFLRGADKVFSERANDVAPGRPQRLVRFYNLRRRAADVIAEIDAELGKGWAGISFHRGQKTWLRGPLPPGASTGLPSTYVVAAIDGRARRSSNSRATGEIDTAHTVEGWTTIVVIERYDPSWYEALLDRLSGPVTKDYQHLGVVIEPGKGSQEFRQ